MPPLPTLQPVYPASDIARITGGKLLSSSKSQTIVHHLIIDSRKIVSGRHDAFFALVSSRNDGHRYISELIEKGVETFVISHMPESAQLSSGACFILVDDTLAALQSLAAHHRSRFSIPVIGITGSNGKTIVKEWLWQLIGSSRNLVRSPKSYNSQIGVPLSVWQMTGGHELGIFEAGISQPDEMHKLEKIIRPTLGIFTNIGPAHGENFTSRLHKASEKIGLFRHCSELICCADHQDVMQAYRMADWEHKPALITWSAKTAADLQITEVLNSDNFTHLSAIYKNNRIELSFPFGDDASVENMICCWLTLLHLGFSNEMIASNAAGLHPVAMRLTLKEGSNNCSLIDDTYSSDLASLSIALNFLKQQNQHRSKAVILSDLLQSGKPENELYAEIAALIASHNISRFVGVGAGMIRNKSLFTSTAAFYVNTEELLNDIPELGFQNESILIKGARIFSFERIVQILQQKTHETVLEVNLDALVHNLNYYKSKLNPSTRIMAMVKAFSYGSGSFEIANILQFQRVDYLAVAYADEGIELRKAGIKLPIMVMNPEEQGFEGMFTYGLEPEIYNLRSLQLLLQAMKRYGWPENKTFRIHLKLDTGMHRLGFSETELPELVHRLGQTNLLVASAFSHLAASDDPAHDDFTNLQISTFKRMSDYLEDQLGYHFLRHILNSAGISRFPEAHFEMVRLGIGLYGISSLPDENHRLEHVSSLKSTISQIKTIKAGATIGYNRNFTATSELKLAIVPVGYADGLSRSLSNGGYSLLVNGCKAPIVGNISMDMLTIDVSGINAREGDEVIIFSPAYPITQLASAMKTIPYEVLTSISRRVKRVYYQE